MYDLDGQEGGLSFDEFETMTTAATYLVFDQNKRGELLRVLFNQVNNECKKANIDCGAVLKEIRDHLNERLSAPQTPEEFSEWMLHNPCPICNNTGFTDNGEVCPNCGGPTP